MAVSAPMPMPMPKTSWSASAPWLRGPLRAGVARVVQSLQAGLSSTAVFWVISRWESAVFGQWSQRP
ncbi:hypothetical protein B9S64_26345 [Streptomyces sp. SM18]|nr:hypothetical protein B9S64_26345 [Streptomyces sp. SM18]